MPTPLLRYEATNMFAANVAHGITTNDFSSLAKKLTHARTQLLDDLNKQRQTWLACPDDKRLVKQVIELRDKKNRFKTCLVIGIGGSDLGARAAWQALKPLLHGMQLEFLGGNTDPDEIANKLARLDLKTTLINLISKSGDTLEPMSTFLIVREALIKLVGRARHADHIVATTDETDGALHALALKEGYATLPIPKTIGGRFSVLTAVGLFPLACAGVDLKLLLTGARWMRDKFVSQPITTNAPSVFAGLHYLGYTRRGLSIHVLMPYAENLKEFGHWYRQLWAESLGKKLNRDGDRVFVGPTPIAALGATDQHSQLQLYTEGPVDKIVTFIEVQRFRSKLCVPASTRSFSPLAYLAKVRLETILHAERQATAEALRLTGRPNGTLLIPNVNPMTLGALFMFFEIAVAIVGELYNIDAYNQPGVESSKHAMYSSLGRPGYAPSSAAVRRSIKNVIF